MNRYEMISFIVFVTTAGATISTIARAYIRRLEAKSQRREIAQPADDDRLERIERAVEAVAIEVERISEGQRFTTKLLSERNGVGAGVANARGGKPGAD